MNKIQNKLHLGLSSSVFGRSLFANTCPRTDVRKFSLSGHQVCKYESLFVWIFKFDCIENDRKILGFFRIIENE